MLTYLWSFFPSIETDLSFVFQLNCIVPNKEPIKNGFSIPCKRYAECMSNIMMALEMIDHARRRTGSTLDVDVKIEGMLYGTPIKQHFTDVESFLKFAGEHGLALKQQKAHELTERKSGDMLRFG